MSEDIIKQVKEKVKEVKKEPVKRKFFPTGLTLFDLVLGGGFPIGGFSNICGHESSGKTLLSIESLFYSWKKYKDKLKIYYDDCESGFNFDIASIYGTEFFKEPEETSEKVEDLEYQLEKQLKSLARSKDKLLFYVVDSLDGLSSIEEKERHDELIKEMDKGKDYNKGSYQAEKNKKLKKTFRLLSKKIKAQNAFVLFASQVGYNLKGYGREYTRAGGKGLDHYCSQIIWLKETEKIIKKKIPIGVRIKIEVTKNKVGKPFRTCFADILFDFGADNIGSNINYLYDLITEKGKLSKKEKLVWDKKEYTRDTLIKHIEKNNLEFELEKRVIEEWNEVEDSITPDRKKKL